MSYNPPVEVGQASMPYSYLGTLKISFLSLSILIIQPSIIFTPYKEIYNAQFVVLNAPLFLGPTRLRKELRRVVMFRSSQVCSALRPEACPPG